MVTRISVFLLALGMFACGKPVLYSEVRQVSPQGWNFTDSLQFEVDVTDTSKQYNLFVAIKNTKDYSYSNLLLFLEGRGPGNIASLDTLQCMLAYPNGRWTGNSFGAEVSNKFLFKPKAKFPATGTYQFKFTHAMRDSALEELTNFGLIIEEVETHG